SQSIEYSRIFERAVHRQQTAERRATQARAGGAGQRLVLAVDQRLDLLDDHPAILIGPAPALALHLGRRVLVDATLARVVDRDDDQRLDLAALDQRLRRLVDVPFLSERCRLVEDVLTILEIEDRITLRSPRFVARR